MIEKTRGNRESGQRILENDTQVFRAKLADIEKRYLARRTLSKTMRQIVEREWSRAKEHAAGLDAVNAAMRRRLERQR